MLGEETRGKTLGCGAMMLLVMLCFWGMLSATDGLAKKVKDKRSRTGQTALKNLQAVGIGVASYEAVKKELPPTSSADAFKAALVPTYLTDAGMLIEPVSGKPFVPNGNVSVDKKWTSYLRRNTYLLASPEQNKAGHFEVLLVSGEVREISPADLTRLANPPAPPAPEPTLKPVGSPAPVRK